MWKSVITALLVSGFVCVGAARAEPFPPDTLYHYRAEVVDVYDGDTVTVDLDLGFHVWVRSEKIRLAYIDPRN